MSNPQTDEVYIKMADCPEIQDLWDVPPLFTLEGYAKHRGDIYVQHCVDNWGEEPQPFDNTECYFAQDIDKQTCVWLPSQGQLQAMSGLPWIDYDHDCMQQAILVWGSGQENRMTKEQAGIRAVMKELHGKTWNGEEWIK